LVAGDSGCQARNVMPMRQIKFTTYGSNTAAGNFAPGDLLRCSDDMARHLVEAARCAAYTDARQEPQRPAFALQAPASKPVRQRAARNVKTPAGVDQQ
jgi:hypothetical protein